MMKLENLSMKPWRLAMVGLGLALASPLSWAAAAIQAITSTQQAGAEVVRIELSEPLAALPAGFVRCQGPQGAWQAPACPCGCPAVLRSTPWPKTSTSI